jgi:hypothetical protein
MQHNKIEFGVIVEVRKNKTTDTVNGWVKLVKDGRIYFRQDSLIDKSEISLFSEGRFIHFQVSSKEIGNDKRPNMNDSFLKDSEQQIIKDIVNYDNETTQFVFEHASSNLKKRLLSKIEKIDRTNPSNDISKKLIEIKKWFPKSKLPQTQKVSKPEDSSVEETSSNSFLETLFELNTAEYNQNLFLTLIEGLKSIDEENIFEQAVFLLKFNDTLKENKIEILNSAFYQKASNHYKFRFWFDGVTDYCSTEILKEYFDKGNSLLKNKIIERCQGDENGYLVLKNMIEDANEFEDVYFDSIRSIILQELDKAKKSISIAVAWFTNDDLFDMLCEKLDNGVTVELIIINDYINNWEHGLLFQNFIDSGGKLYLSEYPSIMHHKFCLIDGEIIFNGSYNWTYYAEKRNDENIMLLKGKDDLYQKFQAEFNRLKDALGEPIDRFEPFDNSHISKFERAVYRKYFSTDLTFRAKAIQKSNPIHASKLIDNAVELDEENNDALTFQEEIKDDVELQQNTIKVQEHIEKTISSVRKSIPNEPKKDKSNSPKTTTIQKDTNESNTLKHNTTNNKITTPFVSNPPRKSQLAKPIIKSYSIPKNEVKQAVYDDVQLAFALDYSTSMERSHHLYSTGKIQKAINLIFAIRQGLTSEQKIDMFLFESKSQELPEINNENYIHYVKKEIIPKFNMGGTNIFAPIENIVKKYSTTSKTILVILITDGENNSPESNLKISNFFKSNSKKSIFWQFVGLGSRFDFLEGLPEIAENISFFNLNDVQSISDKDLLERLLVKFPNWYETNKI